jgi:hypothetical protein
MKNRLTSEHLDLFLSLFPQYADQQKNLGEYLKNFDLSILPLNLALQDGIQKFLPKPGFKPRTDPYGVQRAHSVLTREEEGKKYYLTTYKPGYATFLPILGAGAGRLFCPIGCAGCYRGPQTRFGEPLMIIHEKGDIEQIWIPDPAVQMKWLVCEWNKSEKYSDVYDILLSGGEPMMLSNKKWGDILSELKNARYLRNLRICTGALFLGIPFRFDDELIELLKGFRRETGIQIKLAVHVSHPQQITPESIIYAHRLIEAGIELLPQCPIEVGVNFWSEDLERSLVTLRELDRLLSMAIGTRCYKWILDMQGNISLLQGIELWRRLHDQHKEESDITRPTSFAVFFPTPEGNLNLSYHTLWAIEMTVSSAENIVTYRIPHPAGTWVIYQESLQPRINDSPEILRRLRK